MSNVSRYAPAEPSRSRLNLIWESADETMRSRFFIKNATDEDYIAGYISAATGGGRFGQWGYPRTAGIEIQRNF